MIQIYTNGNQEYSQNGDLILKPESCFLRMELNGAWIVEMVHPVDDQGRYKSIENENVLKVPTPYGDKLFRIYDTEKTPEEITAYARPIFMDAAHEVFIVDKRPTIKNVQQALNILTEGTRYKGQSDITRTSTAYYEYKNLISCISGDDANAIINRWGGEILYDDYTIIINERIGGDYGAMAIAGRNLSAIEERINMDDLTTRIFPKAYNGYRMDGNGYVDSPKKNLYKITYAREVEYPDVKLQIDCQEGETGFNSLLDLREELRRRAEADFEAGADLPTIEMTINMIDLSKRREYREFKSLETVRLGDTVYVRHKKMGITMTSRVISLEYDCIRRQNGEIVLGKHQFNYFSNIDYVANKVSQTVRPDGSVIAERVQGIMNASEVQLKAQKDVANRQDVRAILFEDLDVNSQLYGALAIGTQGLQISKKRTVDGLDWDWTTAITSGGVLAEAVITGLLSDKTGRNFWNLDTGEFTLSSDTKIGDKTLAEILSTNLLKGDPDFAESAYTVLYGTRTEKQSDPQRGRKAVKITAATGSANTLIRANESNVPIKKSGKYTLKFWAKANGSFSGLLVRFNNEKENISLSKTWKEFTMVSTVNSEDDVTTYATQFQIGGSGTFTSESTVKTTYVDDEGKVISVDEPLEVYIYNAVVTKEYSSGEIVNMLTDDGDVKGIYKIGNQLYISMSYILGGGMTLGGERNGNGVIEIKDAAGELVGKLDNNGIRFKKGTITLGSLFTVGDDGKLTANSLNSNNASITGGRLYIDSVATGDYGDNVIIKLKETGRPASMGNLEAETHVRPGLIIQESGNYKMHLYPDKLEMIYSSAGKFYFDYILGFFCDKNAKFNGSLDVKGTKSRVVSTSAGDRRLYAFETPTPLFGDVGSAKTNAEGEAIVPVDIDFGETIEAEYRAFIQAESDGNLYIFEKQKEYFVVKGAPNMKFSWMIMAPQKDFSLYRLDDARDQEDFDVYWMDDIEDEEIDFSEWDDIERSLS